MIYSLMKKELRSNVKLHVVFLRDVYKRQALCRAFQDRGQKALYRVRHILCIKIK